MKIEFVAVRRLEGSFSLEADELGEASATGIDVENRDEVAAYFREQWERDGIIEDIVSDEYRYSETEVIEWAAV